VNRNEYTNLYKKEHYDRINVLFPKGMKDKIKEVATLMDASVSEYIMMLIDEDLANGSSNLAMKKKGFTKEQEVLLQKLQVPKKYYEMIEDVSFGKEGYFIHLKKGHTNDITGSRNIICQTTKEVRTVIVKSHKVTEDVIINGFNVSTLEQLQKWQIPKKYYDMIESIYTSKEGHSVTLKEGFTNDFSGGRTIKVEKANLFRTVMKQSHPK
jgi:hypothetical protein